jgi:hypothetical protein
MITDTTVQTADGESFEPDPVEAAAEAYARDQSARKWPGTIAQVLGSYSVDVMTDPQVRHALDNLTIAASERARRILWSDLPS